MHNFVHDMLHNSPAAHRIESLWRVRFAKSPNVNININLVDCYRNMKMANHLKLNL